MSVVQANGQIITGVDESANQALNMAFLNDYPAYVDGTGYPISKFLGGWLIGGCPLNVALGQGWLLGQQDALAGAGISCGIGVGPKPNESAPVRVAVPSNSNTTGERIGNTGSTTSGGIIDLNLTSGGAGAGNVASTVAAAIAPQLTPGTPGGLPTGQSVGQTGTGGPSTLYRFILASGPGRFDTGANYSGCSSVNTMMCDPQQFSSLTDAVAYANAHGEIPYQCSSAAEVWGIIDGSVSLSPSKVIQGDGGGFSLTTVGILAGLAYLLFK